MTPQERSESLIEKFSPFVTTWDCTNDTLMDEASIIKDATQCAIICVEEMIKEHTFKYPTSWNGQRKLYWQSVLTILKTKV